jgi:hypothetical protein
MAPAWDWIIKGWRERIGRIAQGHAGFSQVKKAASRLGLCRK